MTPIQRIQSQRVFRFLSSVRLAVPLMALLLLSAAAGTIVESRYNASMASLLVYRHPAFLTLMVLLWVNIFCATLSRWPFKKHHTGFVITHIGLLTLLVGGLMTATWGIDGELRIVEGGQDNEVFLPRLVLRSTTGDRVRQVEIPRSLSPLSESRLRSIEEELGLDLRLERFEPFVSAERTFVASKDGSAPGTVAIQVALKSAFFNVAEWLQSRDLPELQLGPARLRLIQDTGAESRAPSRSTSSRRKAQSAGRVAAAGSERTLKVVDAASGQVLGVIPFTQLKKGPVRLGEVTLTLKRSLEDAQVGQIGKKGLMDLGTPGKNPALELTLTRGGQTTREVAFARFPQFSLQTGAGVGVKVEYQVPGFGQAAPVAAAAEAPAEGGDARALPPGHPQVGGGGEGGAAPAPRPMGGNVAEFRIRDARSGELEIRLLKNGTEVLRKTAKVGEVVPTPWMGMELKVVSMIPEGVEGQEVRPITPPERTNMPPSALRVRRVGSEDSDWLVEGEGRAWVSGGERHEIYFGPDSVKLPFQVALAKFEKIDYPGTQMALSFQSRIHVNGTEPETLIRMNEPLKRDGFTLYQASFVERPGQPSISVFSVNQDPGRPVKYVGSLILGLGIIVFTLMRSRWYRELQRKPRTA